MCDKINQSNVFGDNISTTVINEQYKPSIDISGLKDIIFNHKDKIYKILDSIPPKLDSHVGMLNNETMHIERKNILNNLEAHFNNIIIKEEAKLSILQTNFFNNENIDLESKDFVKGIISWICAFNSDGKLDNKAMNDLIIEYQKAFENEEDKALVRLVIYYLYRFCYIGLKE